MRVLRNIANRHVANRLIAALMLMPVGGATKAAPSTTPEETGETVERLTASRSLMGSDQLHLTDSLAPLADDVTISLCSPDAWLFFDKMKPSDVIDNYSSQILIDGESFSPGVNGRIAIWQQGAALMPHGTGFCPLTVYSEPDYQGDSQQMACTYFYTNQPADSLPTAMVRELSLDNEIRSLTLKRGYMATLATGADGMGYSRVLVADTADLTLNELPDLLNAKVSFIRVSPWQYVSKKGWVGSVWSSVPNGMKYVNEQADFTNSTWYYNWSTTTDWTTNPNASGTSPNQDFVPMRWGAGGECTTLYSLDYVSHALGYNEPDHTEQSNVSVETAIAEWPLLQQSGLRLGAPATTNFEWLYSFMTEANKRNYRVDFVPIHAYWGGLSGLEWYNKLKTVYEHTGRPLWITEWNNGANWTNESWPSGTDSQQEKQLRDLKEILMVLDTASFVERYSIYNWVESKRYIITESGTLTPAGEYYADNDAPYFFNRETEMIPSWTVRTAPSLREDGIDISGRLHLSWTDENEEFVDSFTVERSHDQLSWQTVGTVLPPEMETTADPGADETEGEAKAYFRVTSHSDYGSAQTSDVVQVNLLDNEFSTPYFSEILLPDDWTQSLFRSSYQETIPVIVTGALTYRNKMPLSLRLTTISANSFAAKLHAWDYQESPTIANPDTVAVVAMPSGRYVWGGLEAEAASVEHVGTEWTHVSFSTSFKSQPVVFPVQVTDGISSATSVRMSNVTEEGFDLHLQYEGGLDSEGASETVDFLAVTQGQGTLEDGTMVAVGLSPEAAVGDNLSGGYTISYGADFENTPLLFASMQTEEDSITSVLRVKSRDNEEALVFKDREKAVAHERVTEEQVGWMAVGRNSEPDAVTSPLDSHTESNLQYDSASQCVRRASFEPMTLAIVFSVTGQKLMELRNVTSVPLASLQRGVYIVIADGSAPLKISKK